jgi:DNA polymerase-3 subunit gamma/tau
LAEAVLTGEAHRFLATLDDIFDRGHDLKKLYADLLEYMRDLWVIQVSPAPEKLIDLPGHEIERMQEQAGRSSRAALEHALDVLFREEPAVRLSPQPKLALEMAFFRIRQTRGALSIGTLISKLDELRRDVQGVGNEAPPSAGERSSGAAPAPGAAASGPARGGSPSTGPPPAGRRSAADPPERPTELEVAWQKITERIGASQPSLAAKLKRCCLRRGGAERVEIVASGNSFVDSTLRRDRHMAVLRKVCAEVFGGAPEVVVVAGDECGSRTSERRDRHQARVKETLNHPLVAEAIEIFNGKLVDVQVSQEVDK